MVCENWRPISRHLNHWENTILLKCWNIESRYLLSMGHIMAENDWVSLDSYVCICGLYVLFSGHSGQGSAHGVVTQGMACPGARLVAGCKRTWKVLYHIVNLKKLEHLCASDLVCFMFLILPWMLGNEGALPRLEMWSYCRVCILQMAVLLE